MSNLGFLDAFDSVENSITLDGGRFFDAAEVAVPDDGSQIEVVRDAGFFDCYIGGIVEAFIIAGTASSHNKLNQQKQNCKEIISPAQYTTLQSTDKPPLRTLAETHHHDHRALPA